MKKFFEMVNPCSRKSEKKYCSSDGAYGKTPLSKPRMALMMINYVGGYLFLIPSIASRITLSLDPYAVELPVWMQWIIYMYMIVSTVILIYPLLKESLDALLQDHTHFMRTMVQLFILLYISSMLFSYFASMLSKTQTSANQSDVSASVEMFPLLMIFSTLLFAPIVEEALFRGVIFRSLRFRHGFLFAAVISCSAFGLLHVYQSILSMQYQDLWYFFVYAGIGFFLALAYEKTHSIYGAMLLHMMNNALAVISILLW